MLKVNLNYFAPDLDSDCRSDQIPKNDPVHKGLVYRRCVGVDPILEQSSDEYENGDHYGDHQSRKNNHLEPRMVQKRERRTSLSCIHFLTIVFWRMTNIKLREECSQK